MIAQILFDSGHAFYGWLFKATWQASVLIVIILLVQRCFRVPVHWRRWFWLLVGIRLALPAAPSSEFSIYNVFRSAGELGWRTAARSVPEGIATPPGANTALDAGVVVTEGIPAHSADPSLGTSSAVGAQAQGLTRFRLATVIPLLWVSGVVLLLARLGLGTFQVWKTLRREPCGEDSTLLKLLEECRAQLRVGRRVRLVRPRRFERPAVYGLLRPRILLPERLLGEFTAKELRFVLLHELAHIQRWDLAWNWASAFLQILHWFNPLVWIAGRRMRDDAELACDRIAIAAAGEAERTAYGQTVIKVVEGLEFSVSPELSGRDNEPVVTIKPALERERLSDLLEVIVRTANQPLHYVLEEPGRIVFKPGARLGASLHTRIFNLDAGLFLKVVARFSENPAVFAREADGTYKPGTQAATQVAVRRMFAVFGINTYRPI